ncbi:MAG: DUF1223 domain-containing protein [Rhodospirillales bacterium]
MAGCAGALRADRSVGAALAADQTAGPVVVELYTSQGCSSCPPADANLGELAQAGDIIGLSFHVDYWDYIGWKDPFAKPEHGERQRDYAAHMGKRSVYTPQMIIQGAEDVVGSRERDIKRAIAAARRAPKLPVSLKRADGGAVVITLPGASGAGVGAGAVGEPADVILIGYDTFHETRVKRGENAGRTLGHFNVVRAMWAVGEWTGAAQTITAPAPEAGDGGVAVLVQARGGGRILGAAQIPPTPGS